MKILHINGDHYNPTKKSMIAYQMLKESIVKKADIEEVELEDDSLDTLKNCRGCKICFKVGKCIYENKDDINIIKNKIMESDLIIISTPVFIDNISGNLKTLFDRLSYWFHVMPLIGKNCIIIISTYRSGIDDVTKYLYKILTYLGLEIVGIITLNNLVKDDNIKHQADIASESLFERNLSKVNCSRFKNYIFKTYDNTYIQINKKNTDSFETKLWFALHHSE